MNSEMCANPACGHSRAEHYAEQNYECGSCDCEGFAFPPLPFTTASETPDSQISHSDPSKSKAEMSPERMKEIRERADKVPANWFWRRNYQTHDGTKWALNTPESLRDGRIAVLESVTFQGWEHSLSGLPFDETPFAQFVQHARQDIPDLLAEVERLRAAPLSAIADLLREALVDWIPTFPLPKDSPLDANRLDEFVRRCTAALAGCPTPRCKAALYPFTCHLGSGHIGLHRDGSREWGTEAAPSLPAPLGQPNEELVSIFRWLLGEIGEFPESVPGKRYAFRFELRTRLAAIGFDISESEPV